MRVKLNKFDQCRCDLGQSNCGSLNCSQKSKVRNWSTNLPVSGRRKMGEKSSSFKLQIAAILILVVIVLCSYKLWNSMDCKQAEMESQVRRLKMVNMFQRHGDRSPSDHFPKGDKHADHLKSFWPDGLTNLTDTGRLRMYRIGLETRLRYEHYLGRDSKEILALSSHIFRCKESIDFFLRGLYDTEWTKSTGLSLLKSLKDKNCTSGDCLPSGSGSKEEWKTIEVDTKTLPTLSYDYITECDCYKSNPNPVDSDLMASLEIKGLPGIEKLRDLLKTKYDQDFDIVAPSVWSTICVELELIRTNSNFELTDHFRDWIFEPVAKRGDSVLTLFNLFEEVAVLAYRDAMIGQVNLIQSGTLLTSMVESQLVALGHKPDSRQMEIYRDKKMVIYSTHDSILQLLLFTIGLIRTDGGPFEERFFEWTERKDHDNHLGMFLDGLKMSNYGISIRFELLELEREGIDEKFNVVQAFIYNREEPKYHEVRFELVELGEACRRLFKSKYPSADLDRFYPKGFYINHRHDCPFNLWRNVTSELMVSEENLVELCGEKERDK